jgi:hypothetical protein
MKKWSLSWLPVAAALVVLPIQVAAEQYTVNVQGVFNTQLMPSPNSLGFLLGTTFSGAFTSDSHPGPVATSTITVGSETGWFLPGPNYRLTLSGGQGSGLFAVTVDDAFLSGSESRGFLPEGTYDIFELEGYAPGWHFGNLPCLEPFQGPGCSGGSGLVYKLTLLGYTDMLSDPTHPGPSTIDTSRVIRALLVGEEYVSGALVGEIFSFGVLSAGDTLDNLNISPVPEVDAVWMFLAGIGVLLLQVVRRRTISWIAEILGSALPTRAATMGRRGDLWISTRKPAARRYSVGRVPPNNCFQSDAPQAARA